MRICLMVLAAATALLPQPGAAQSAFSYRGMCDASAGIALDTNHFAVADDELNVLRIYRFGQAEPAANVPVQKFLGTKEKKESDLEGAARIGDRIYWISSHGTNSEGEVQDRRKRLFATDIVQGPIPSLKTTGAPFANLVERLAEDKRYEQFGLAAAAKIPPKDPGGLSIEGLAATSDGNLLIGFRNPITASGAALVVPLKSPDKVVTGSAPEFLDPIELKGLDGRGIRSIERYKDGFLVIAGAFGAGGNFNLFRWTGKGADAAVTVAGAPLGGLSVEGLLVLPDGENIMVLSDDGEVKEDGVKCKDNADEKKKSFRTLTMKP